MSTNGSESSQIRRFGLYRSIDAKTEEFLRLSRKRQMRQGCVCAAVSTTITVTVVIIVLLIYEYMIAVETSFVQNKRNKTKYIAKDIPVADRLDRNFLGFDQDYYERMPLLINALQEISNTDSEAHIRSRRKQYYSKYYTVRPRTTTVANKFIRRTSPRPFIFEYRSPYPMPFSKANSNSKYWEEQYRNAQRLKNLHDVVKYLEKTLNAKFGDIILPSKTQIALSGVYVEPVEHTSFDGSLSFKRGEKKSNHYLDPLHIFRPESPGEINLLADGLRFAPIFLSKLKRGEEVKHSDYQKRNCVGGQCLFLNNNFKNDFARNEETTSTTTDNYNINSIGLFNFFPNKVTNSQESAIATKIELDKIYITTSRPIYKFKRKSATSLRRNYYKSKVRPKFFQEKKEYIATSLFNNKNLTLNNYYPTVRNFSNKVNVTKPKSYHFDTTTVTSNEKINLGNSLIIYPKLNYSDIEDYHVGSSGVIPPEDRTQTSFIPIATPIAAIRYPYTTEATTTNPPEIFKFTPDDATIPEHYFNIRKSDIVDVTEYIENQFDNSEVNKNIEEHEANTLIVKLRNIVESTSKINVDLTSTESTETYEEDISTTKGTYVPQINGHYRHIKRKNLTALLQENSEKYRKKRIEKLLTIRNSTYVPMYEYVEIQRNRDTGNSGQDN